MESEQHVGELRLRGLKEWGREGLIIRKRFELSGKLSFPASKEGKFIEG